MQFSWGPLLVASVGVGFVLAAHDCNAREGLSCNVEIVSSAAGNTMLQAAARKSKALPKVLEVVLQSAIAEDGEPSRARSFRAKLDKYPAYHGSVKVLGEVRAIQHEDRVDLSWTLTGADDHCSHVGSARGSCGIHIHTGTTCSEHGDIGGHQLVPGFTDDSVWAQSIYTTVNRGPQIDESVTGNVTIHAKLGEIGGKVVVVHNYRGIRVACGVLENATAETPAEASYARPHNHAESSHVKSVRAKLDRYPGYHGTLRVLGEVKAIQHEDRVELFWQLTGVDPHCSHVGHDPGSCGIQIHTGMSCSEDGLVGDPQTVPNFSNASVWRHSAYTTAKEGIQIAEDVIGNITIHAKVGDIAGRVVVVHNYEGVRVACGVLGDAQASEHVEASHDEHAEAAPVDSHEHAQAPQKVDAHVGASHAIIFRAELNKYPGYHGSLQVLGEVRATQHEDRVDLSWQLTGADAHCSHVGHDPGSCGIHIHSGTTCSEDGLIGGHLMAPGFSDDSVWQQSTYAVKEGITPADTVTGGVTIHANLGVIGGKAVVVHDFEGNRVACAVLGDAQAVEEPPAITAEHAKSSPAPTHEKTETPDTEADGNVDAVHAKADEHHTAKVSHRMIFIAKLDKYPQYQGVLQVLGEVRAIQHEDRVSLSWKLSGADAHCSHVGHEAGSCGIHVHSGTTCSEDGLIGGHLMVPGFSDDSVWQQSTYAVKEGITPADTVTGGVTIHANLGVIGGKAVVVHDFQGVRVACGILGDTSEPSKSKAAGSFQWYCAALNAAVFVCIVSYINALCAMA